MSVFASLAGVVDETLDRAVVPGYSRLGYALRRRTWPGDDPAPNALAARTVLVTGAGSGIGLATCRAFAELGATVLAVGRDPDRGEQAAAQVAVDVPDADIRFERCDVSNLAEVRAFGADLCRRHDRLDVVVHNAGVLPPRRTESDQGHEVTLATHVLGPILLTESLLPLFEQAAPARVVVVSSGGAYTTRLHVEDLEYRTGRYLGANAYARTKRMQIALTPVLDRRWSSYGARAYSMHPGWADTPGVADSLPFFRRLTGALLRDAEQAADTVVWLAATATPPPGGTFWHDRRIRPTHYLPQTRETAAEIEALWQFCCNATEIARSSRASNKEESE
ncbi:MAG TPA: SDR family NAD(P)-dependent oxidoreductase [Aldersonia sp.]